MSEITLFSLIATAISLGFIHTILGPDHYLPFVALSKSNKWSYRKTIIISAICGIAHCLSSVVIGFVGIAAGILVGRLEAIESFRGDIASYIMIAFGLAYLVWAIKNLIKKKKHSHIHSHGDLPHDHEHSHSKEHVHVHGSTQKNRNLFWGIFIVFIFGPCEPLIPLLMYPAAKSSLEGTIGVALSFTIVTVLTMLVVITIGYRGLGFFKFPGIVKYSDVFASSTIIACGVLIIIGL